MHIVHYLDTAKCTFKKKVYQNVHRIQISRDNKVKLDKRIKFFFPFCLKIAKTFIKYGM